MTRAQAAIAARALLLAGLTLQDVAAYLRAHPRAMPRFSCEPIGAAFGRPVSFKGDLALALHRSLSTKLFAGDRAMTFYVNTTHGNDGNAGSILTPWRTEEHARRTAKPGDEIWINDGRGFVRLDQRPDNGRAHDDPRA